MRVSPLLFLFTLWGVIDACAQSRQHYQAGAVGKHNSMKLTLNAASVSCKISPTHSIHAVNVFGYPQEEDFNPVSDVHTSDEVRKVSLNFDQSLSTSLSAKVINHLSEARESPWYVYLSRNTPFSLELNYGVGSSSVDLSGLSVEKFKINTGSAEIRVGFDGDKPNKVRMDTLMAKVDLGVLELDKLDMARAAQVIAQIGFGKLRMHLTDQIESSTITASVGAGTLEVVFDNTDIPVIVHLSDSPLCRVKLLKDFKEIAPETFVNTAYHPAAENLVSFNIDVAMGNVVFKKNH